MGGEEEKGGCEGGIGGVFMECESGVGLCACAFPNATGAKLDGANTAKNIIRNIYYFLN